MHTRVQERQSILEVGCGGGGHSLNLAKSGLLQRGATLAITDISDKMLEKAQERFTHLENEFVDRKYNKVQIITTENESPSKKVSI